MAESSLTFYHAPQTRSTGVRILLEELGAPFHLQLVNMKAGEQRKPAFLAVNPMGKVPAIRHGGTLVTEQVAIFIYLADYFAERELAPGLKDPLRGSYLRWMVFYASCFEPAVTDKFMKRDAGDARSSPYGTYGDVIGAIIRQLEAGPYMLGTRFSAADILWGMALRWTRMFGIVEPHPTIDSYVARMTQRPAFAKVDSEDATLAAEHEKAASVTPA
ncbi:MAG TPA: glutathione S-transferase family protein [Dongiaceae bacterium]|nr:glutathione S-transferase family protein [Dongiaceae bacterium]